MPYILKVHENCRKKYLREADVPKLALTSTSSDVQQNEFSFKENCLFCGEQAQCVSRGKSTKNVHHVSAFSFRETISRIITERLDEWATEVSLRIQSETDLVAVNAAYHQQCNVNFRTGRNKPNANNGLARRGAPVNMELNDSFLRLVQFLEESDEPYSTSDLSEKFQEFSGGEKYTVRYLKDKLVKHFGDQIIFVSRNGLSDVVVMREASERIIIKSYEGKCKSSDEISTFMETAANTILTDIKSIKNNKDTYPSPSEIASVDSCLSFMPQSLITFLTILFGQKKSDQITKIISFGHAIIQVCRPRCLLSPIQFGLAVQVSVLTASR